MSDSIAKHLLLGHSCLSCKWGEKKRVVPDLEVTIDIYDTYQQICNNPDYVLLQGMDDIIVGEFDGGIKESSFWCTSPKIKLCELWTNI